MNNIEWKDGAVCYANGKQFFMASNGLLFDFNQFKAMRQVKAIEKEGFKLNEIRTGDYIEASELDTEQKYNEVVEVFGLFGVKVASSYWCLELGFQGFLCGSRAIVGCYANDKDIKRKLTYAQIIAIGKLKRLIDEKENSGPFKKPEKTERLDFSGVKFSVETPMPEVKEPKQDNVKNPKHYQLIEGVESIEVIARSMTKEQWKGFCLGNMLKYRIRAGKKDALQQDIDKANFYGELYEMHKERCYA